jgi:mono/diheme cytochrome c family protein
MTVRVLFLLFQAVIFSSIAYGQQSIKPLTDTQQLGRRVFKQRCAACHTRPTLLTKKPWGPTLSKDILEGNEDAVRELILKGRLGRMPGFQYGLEEKEVDAIIEYLKLVPRMP